MKTIILIILFSLFVIPIFAQEDVYITEVKKGSKLKDIPHNHYFKKFEKKADGNGYDRVIVDLKWCYKRIRELEKKMEKLKTDKKVIHTYSDLEMKGVWLRFDDNTFEFVPLDYQELLDDGSK